MYSNLFIINQKKEERERKNEVKNYKNMLRATMKRLWPTALFFLTNKLYSLRQLQLENMQLNLHKWH